MHITIIDGQTFLERCVHKKIIGIKYLIFSCNIRRILFTLFSGFS